MLTLVPGTQWNTDQFLVILIFRGGGRGQRPSLGGLVMKVFLGDSFILGEWFYSSDGIHSVWRTGEERVYVSCLEVLD